MRKFFILSLALTVAAGQISASAQDLGSLFKGLTETVKDAVVGTTEVSESSISGTWTYSGPAVEFESENFLTQAGGEVAAQTVESKITELFEKIGFKSGSTSYSFSTDGTYTQTICGKTLSGTYTLSDSRITMKTGVGLSFSADVEISGSTLKLLFNADKLLELIKTTSGTLSSSGNTSLSTLASLIENYDGLSLGFELSK